MQGNIKGEVGDPGQPGTPGENGEPGSDGTNSYIYIRYSTDADGTGFDATPTPSKKYMGVYSGQSSTAPTNKTSYAWVKYIGEDGQGVGDMLKSTYDTNNNGKVDDSDKLGGQLPSYYQQSTNGLTEETAIADADTMSFYDASENENRKSTWANIVSKLKDYFDEYYNKYILPKATTSTLGGIKPDGTTITVNEDGVASSAGASGTILDSGTAIKNNTTADQICGALGAKELFGELNSNLGDLAFAQDAYGKWGYKVGGADPVIPFKSGCEAVSTTTTATIGTYTIVSNALSSGKICIWVKRNAGVSTMPYSCLRINETEIASKQQSQEVMVYYECDYNIGDTITIKLKSGDPFPANIYSVVIS